MAKDLTHFIGGAHVAGKSGRFLDVTNPNTGEVTARTPLATAAELRAAVEVAAKAFPA
ncbi:MAG: methylmalonate-semialdehyde dehydrogenase (CoA acylating), partial [Parvibaculum sp.]|nr:methylmalonate-semialdehyde dehydrogenase (CoA acylating) [Parvibaculum sp.]